MYTIILHFLQDASGNRKRDSLCVPPPYRAGEHEKLSERDTPQEKAWRARSAPPY